MLRRLPVHRAERLERIVGERQAHGMLDLFAPQTGNVLQNIGIDPE
ncbi:hypothetical protein [Aurantimonas marina]|nr:hypothetical protein [Aurantimonas marina]